jgi:PqqD family protein of HPr-rel-A system
VTGRAQAKGDPHRASVWVAARPDDLVWVGWGQDYAVYDCGTGQTHLINELPAEILRLLARTPASAAEIAARLAEECGVDDDERWLQQIADVMSSLEALDLLEKKAQ